MSYTRNTSPKVNSLHIIVDEDSEAKEIRNPFAVMTPVIKPSSIISVIPNIISTEEQGYQEQYLTNVEIVHLYIVSDRQLLKTIRPFSPVLGNITAEEEGIVEVRPSFWVFDTVVRGLVFLFFQAYEYVTSLFTISDSVYGGTFFALTGLHGFHVFIGVLFLFTFLIFNPTQGGLACKYNTPFVKAPYWLHRVAFDGAA